MPRAFTFVPQANPRPLGELPELQAARNPDRTALICGDVALTCAQFAARVRAGTRALLKAGVQEGDFVALALPNGAPVLALSFACWRLGATPVPLSPRFPPAELDALLAVLAPRLVVREATCDEYFDDDDTAPLPPSRIAPHVKAIASGGSTGRPKVIVDHAPSVLDPDAPSAGMRSGDTVVIPGPMYHSAPYGLAYQGLGWGCTVVIVPKFDAAETLALIERHRAAWLYQVPTMMHRIWNLGAARDRHDLSSLELVCHIAAACPPWLKRAWIDWLGPDRLWEVYSGTEAIGATTIGGREWLEHPGSVGRLAPGMRMRLLDDEGREVPRGEVGEIYFLPAGGPGSTYHYLGAEPKRRGEWESFGDLGRLDADDYLYIADRRTDLIISGGANVYPAEIEAAIEGFPGVMASVAIGLPDADLGQRVHAIVEMDPARPAPDRAALNAFIAERLAPYKRPKSLEFTSERLRDDSGKVRRGALREARLPLGG